MYNFFQGDVFQSDSSFQPQPPRQSLGGFLNSPNFPFNEAEFPGSPQPVPRWSPGYTAPYMPTATPEQQAPQRSAAAPATPCGGCCLPLTIIALVVAVAIAIALGVVLTNRANASSSLTTTAPNSGASGASTVPGGPTGPGGNTVSGGPTGPAGATTGSGGVSGGTTPPGGTTASGQTPQPTVSGQTSAPTTAVPTTSTPPPTIPINQCDLPFTYNGNLYYTCINNVTGVNIPNGALACPNVNGIWNLCAPNASFVVANTTMSLTIPTTSNSIQVMSVNGWIIIHQRLDSTLNWTLPWSSYKAGFGTANGDYWMGNDNIHLVTTSKLYRLRMEVLSMTMGWFSTEYNLFTLDAESNFYQIHVSQYVPWDGGDIMNYNKSGGVYVQNGMNFTTFDQQHDHSQLANCASVGGGGFWYNDCWEFCLTCTNGSAYTWYDLPGNPLLQQSRMMIKPA